MSGGGVITGPQANLDLNGVTLDSAAQLPTPMIGDAIRHSRVRDSRVRKKYAPKFSHELMPTIQSAV